MILLRSYESIISSDGKNHIIAEIDVDTASELPPQEYGEYFLHMGSIARDVSTGAFYSINSSGTWYNQDGSGAASND
jgi:hypothetical protein